MKCQHCLDSGRLCGWRDKALLTQSAVRVCVEGVGSFVRVGERECGMRRRAGYIGMPDYGATVRGDYDQASVFSLGSRRSVLGMMVVVLDLVVVQVIGKQRTDMYVAVPRLPASIVMIEHGAEAWQQRNRSGDRRPDDPRSHTPDCRKSHDWIIVDGTALLRGSCVPPLPEVRPHRQPQYGHEA